MGVWIEIVNGVIPKRLLRKFTPVWGCGLKSCWRCSPGLLLRVHPRVGVWIEILSLNGTPPTATVHPRVGVWIEILLEMLPGLAPAFTPVWGCGLKWIQRRIIVKRVLFTPVWGCGLKLCGGRQ